MDLDLSAWHGSLAPEQDQLTQLQTIFPCVYGLTEACQAKEAAEAMMLMDAAAAPGLHEHQRPAHHLGSRLRDRHCTSVRVFGTDAADLQLGPREPPLG